MKLKKDITVVVGLSGGVDSSVAAFLLKESGYNVIGMFMKNWSDDDTSACTYEKDYEDALHVCEKINIPCHTINFEKEYYEKVFTNFLEEYQKGYTPNPDILCNREIKFNVFLQKAKKFGANFLATGHYAKIEKENDIFILKKALDLSKDQSYFLYTLKSSILKNVLFPLQDLTKKQVRDIAKKNDLITHNKKDSTGICFIGKRSFRPFLSKFIGYKKGNMIDIKGNIIGQHRGISFYTIGQRKGLEIGGAGDAWFVADKNVKTNELTVVQGKNHPALFASSLVAKDLSFVNEKEKFSFPYKCRAKIRYRQDDQDCIINSIKDGKAYVEFTSPQRAIALGQSIVFYSNVRCLGGGIIDTKGPSLLKNII